MARPRASVQVPGQEAAEAIAASPQVEQFESADGDLVTVSKASLDALISRVTALESKGRAGLAKSPHEKKPLPDADGIDPSKLKTPVLTKQGWVVPENYGANPNAPKAF